MTQQTARLAGSRQVFTDISFAALWRLRVSAGIACPIPSRCASTPKHLQIKSDGIAGLRNNDQKTAIIKWNNEDPVRHIDTRLCGPRIKRALREHFYFSPTVFMSAVTRQQFLRSIVPPLPHDIVIGHCGHTHEVKVNMGRTNPRNIGRLFHFVG